MNHLSVYETCIPKCCVYCIARPDIDLEHITILSNYGQYNKTNMLC